MRSIDSRGSSRRLWSETADEERCSRRRASSARDVEALRSMPLHRGSCRERGASRTDHEGLRAQGSLLPLSQGNGADGLSRVLRLRGQHALSCRSRHGCSARCRASAFEMTTNLFPDLWSSYGSFITFLTKPVAYPSFGIHDCVVGKEVRMTTTLQSLRFGVEIETVGCPKDRLTRAINIALPGSRIDSYRENTVIDAMGRSWSVVRDGSLSGSDNGEIVTPPLNYTDLASLQNVIRSVRQAGARVDSSCGIHIHVDGAAFAAKSLTNLV